MRRTLVSVAVFMLGLLCVAAPLSAGPDTFQKSISVAESFVSLGLLFVQGTDTPLELAAFAGTFALQTVPNIMMLLGERAGAPQFTRIMRWTNFGVDCAIGAGAIGVGIAYLAGAFGPGADLRMLGGLYLALSIPAAVAAYADTVPYAVENP